MPVYMEFPFGVREVHTDLQREVRRQWEQIHRDEMLAFLVGGSTQPGSRSELIKWRVDRMGDELAAVEFDWPDRWECSGPPGWADRRGIFNENAYIPGRYLP